MFKKYEHILEIDFHKFLYPNHLNYSDFGLNFRESLDSDGKYAPFIKPLNFKDVVSPEKYVGYADMPNQIFRSLAMEGFDFNLMVVGLIFL